MLGFMTGTSHNLKGELDYIGDKSTQAHQNDNGVTKRNIAMAGIGVRTDSLEHIREDFNALNKKNPLKVKTLDYVLAPEKDEINPNDSESVRRFTEYSAKVARKAFPHHLVLIAVQHDNTHNTVHSHLIVSNLSTVAPHHAINHNRIGEIRFQKTAERVRENGYEDLLNPMKINGQDYRNQATRVHDTVIKEKVQFLYNRLKQGHYQSHTDMRRAGKSIGLQLRFSRKHKYRVYKMKRDKNGKLVFDMRTDKHGKEHKRLLYRRHTTGKKKGQFIYQYNHHGNKRRIPVTKTKSGVTVRLLKDKPTRQGKHSKAPYNPFTKLSVIGFSANHIQQMLSYNRKYSKTIKAKFDRIRKAKAERAKTAKIKAIRERKARERENNQSDKQFEEDLPDITPAVNNLNEKQVATLKDDLELTPRAVNPKTARQAQSKMQKSHAKHDIPMDINDSRSRPIFNILKAILQATRYNAHRIVVAVKHYDKIISNRLNQMKRNTKNSLNKYAKILKRNSQKSKQIKHNLNHSKPNDTFIIGRKRAKERNERAKSRQTRNRRYQSNNQSFDR